MNPQYIDYYFLDYYHCSATTGKGSNQKGKQFVDIYFHCIVAANLISSFERDKLFVVFEDTTLGGWKARKYQMKGLR